MGVSALRAVTSVCAHASRRSSCVRAERRARALTDTVVSARPRVSYKHGCVCEFRYPPLSRQICVGWKDF